MGKRIGQLHFGSFHIGLGTSLMSSLTEIGFLDAIAGKTASKSHAAPAHHGERRR